MMLQRFLLTGLVVEASILMESRARRFSGEESSKFSKVVSKTGLIHKTEKYFHREGKPRNMW